MSSESFGASQRMVEFHFSAFVIGGLRRKRRLLHISKRCLQTYHGTKLITVVLSSLLGY